MATVTIVTTGVANLASVRAAFERVRVGEAPVQVRIATARHDVEEADMLVLPGVGSFGAGMARLEEMNCVDAIRDRVASGRPTLGVCLGMQLLCAASEESPGVAGLGIVDQTVKRFEGRAPQFGWNVLTPGPGCALLEGGSAYFANSFRLVETPPGWCAAMSDHAGPFVGAMERGHVLACQCHPELSGAYGAALLQRWVVRSLEGAPC